MKSLKYLNCVLTVIAVCLVVLTISVIGAFPKANASANVNKFVNSPLEKDRITNTVVQNRDLIMFTSAETNQDVWINKHNVTAVSFLPYNKSIISLSGGAPQTVKGLVKDIAGKLNE
jgi:hypothetical protein